MEATDTSPAEKKQALGLKRECPDCCAKFYDFNRTELTCPKCKSQFTLEALLTALSERRKGATQSMEVSRYDEDDESDIHDVDDEDDDEDDVDSDDEDLDTYSDDDDEDLGEDDDVLDGDDDAKF